MRDDENGLTHWVAILLPWGVMRLPKAFFKRRIVEPNCIR
jgi:hypothetical protein